MSQRRRCALSDTTGEGCALRLLCVNNGGLTLREGRPYANRANAGFLQELGAALGSVRFASWVPESADPLQDVSLDDIPGVSAWPLPHPHGPFVPRVKALIRAGRMMAAAVAWSDFVYAYCPGRLGMLTTLWARRLQKPYGLYVRGMLTIESAPWRSSFRGAQFALTTGDPLRRTVARWCRDVRNVTPMTMLRQECTLLARPPRRPGPFRILYVGRLDRRKGTHDLLRAAAILHAKGFDFRLQLVGHRQSPQFGELETPDAVRPRIEWVGTITEPSELMQRYLDADVFVLPSHDEGFPRVLYEAMALGVPVVTTMVGSIPGVMRAEDNCVAIESGQPAQIVAVLERLAGDPALAARLAQQGRADMRRIMLDWQKSHAAQILAHICPGSSSAGARGDE